MNRKDLPASGGRYVRDDKGALKRADEAQDTPAQAADTPAPKTPRTPARKGGLNAH